MRYLSLLSLLATFSYAQNPVPPTPFKERKDNIVKQINSTDKSLVKNLRFNNIGPTVMSGRVVDIDVNPKDPTEFYVAYASGGLWKTTTNGNSFVPVFDKSEVITIGDIAIDWEHGERIWIGTGESNSSRSSYAGMGIYRSDDKGKTFVNLGLEETQHISRIIIDPSDANTILVAAIGHLYTPNKERGVFKSTDGGKTWKQVLFIDENTGVIDLEPDPSNPKTIYAASWYRTRRAWNFEEAGKTSGIHKSSDGGTTWTLLTTNQSGFPTGDGVGRIGLSVSPSNPMIVYAFVDNQGRRPEEKKEGDKLSKNLFKTISNEDFLKLSDKELEEFLRNNDFPEKHTASSVKEMVKTGKLKPIALAEYLEDANSLLFDTPIIGAELYRSEDGGKTWKKTLPGYMDGMYHTYGYYFGNIRISSSNPDEIYLVGFVILYSSDGGKTFKSLNRDNTHVDYHALWINKNKKGHLICGNDGGLNISYDNGETWVKCNSLPVGQFYAITYDMAEPFNVYGGLQDNGVWVGPSNYVANYGWYQEGQYPYKSIMGGDGMQVQVDPRDNKTVYTGFQFGNYFRIDKNTGDAAYITPKHELGERPYRYNWQSPIWLSIHNPDILYLGSNHFHRSFNQGKEFKTMSGDLTQGGKKGDVAFGTLTTIHESPLRFGLIYTGSDDGLIHLTKDGGYTWTKVSNGLPANMWVSRVWASAFKESRVYCSLNGYRWDNFTPMIYVSEDYGTTWNKIGADLPMEPVNVIKEDPVNENLLFVGTDNGAYVSLDRGKTFMALSGGLPRVAVHDLFVHPRDHKLVLGTHGRSIYLADISELQQLNAGNLEKEYVLFDLEKQRYSDRWGSKSAIYEDPYTSTLPFTFYSRINSTITWEIQADSTLTLYRKTQTCAAGLNFDSYDFSIDSNTVMKYETWLNSKKKEGPEIKVKRADNKQYYLKPGTYRLVIRDMSTGTMTKKQFEIFMKK